MLTFRGLSTVVVPQLVLLTLGLLLGWGGVGWGAALVALVLVDVGAVHLARRTGARRLGPADVVTLVRATLTCAVVGLVAASFAGRPVAAWAVAGVAALSLSLDRVDGQVARATGTSSAFGARLDGEGDALLMLVLSVWVGSLVGWWVLVIGLARYLFAAAGRVWPWLRGQLPFRYWRKVVTAVASICLTVTAADVLPPAGATAAMLVALLLVGESFGRDVLWLWARRRGVGSVS